EAVEPVFDQIVLTNNGSPRAVDTESLAEIARPIFGDDRIVVKPFLPDAVETAIGLAEESEGEPVSGAGVVITGSVVTAGAARTLFGKEPT
ncbi:dihydrofolate synthase, partial [Streptomyces sp. SID10244]|nr:dihydrofolate synthase [Streptomyces sp. SID10244]